ncbi:solute carrier family 23 member 1-like [Mercenaria mercenaria]|uniref:solute carrier family 23 member 1-like n=1 Tax=Mercenaria mercenaria TaxID=6596 RepID=UPI00234EB4A2|nr:solute carrier family 23 member 1-like [Mercenaria mercenaria]
MDYQKDNDTGRKPEVTKRMLYDVEENPPWYLCLLLGFQHCLLVFGSSIPVPLLLSELFCMDRDKVAVSELIGTTFFVTGLSTLIQTTVGVRLPLVQGCSASFLTQVITLMTPRQCPEREPVQTDTGLKITDDMSLSSSVYMFSSCVPLDDATVNISSNDLPDVGSDAYRAIWTSRIREVQGGVMVVAVFEIIIGCSGTLGFLLRYVGPLTLTPTLTLIGLSLFTSSTAMASEHWWIALTTMFLFTLSSQYLRNIEIPLPGLSRLCSSRRLPLFSLFPVLIGIFGTWAICAILTVCSVLPDSPGEWGYTARTDIGLDVLKDARWFRVPYPGQWGAPNITAAGVVSMFVAVIVTMIDAIGNVYACVAIADAPPIPGNVVNRGIFVQGICCLLAGIWGTGNGTTTASDNMSIIGAIKVASLRVIQTCGVLLIIFGCFGKFGALFTTIPLPIIGGMLMSIFGIITGVGLSFLQFIDLNSFRNIFILGVSLFFGVSISNWMLEHQDAINTGSDFLDQIFAILLSTSMFVGAVTGFVLDNTIPGTDAERGIRTWRAYKPEEAVDLTKTQRLKIYDLPLITKYFRNNKLARHLPFCFSSSWCVDKLVVRGDITNISVDTEITVSRETVFSVTESVKL